MTEYTFIQLEEDIQLFLSDLNHKDNLYYNFFAELSLHGFRINELINISNWIKKPSNIIEIPTLKGNNNRFINLNNFMLFTQTQLNDNNFIYTHINQSSASFCFKSFYPRIKIYHETKSLTNHLFRHYKAKSLKLSGWNDVQIQNYFGEISLENMQNYIYSILYYE